MRVYMSDQPPHRLEIIMDGMNPAQTREMLNGIEKSGIKQVDPLLGHVALVATAEQVKVLEQVPGLDSVSEWADRFSSGQTQ
jgi:hypothetical protein